MADQILPLGVAPSIIGLSDINVVTVQPLKHNIILFKRNVLYPAQVFESYLCINFNTFLVNSPILFYSALAHFYFLKTCGTIQYNTRASW